MCFGASTPKTETANVQSKIKFYQGEVTHYEARLSTAREQLTHWQEKANVAGTPRSAEAVTA